MEKLKWFRYFKSNSYISSDENKAVPDEKTEEVTEEKAPASDKQIDQNALLLEMAKLLVGSGGLGAALPSSPANSSAKLKPAMVMKDLKLDGVIGAEGEKNKMSFTSLCYQIRNAQKLGHSEAAICNAILIAISPTNNLRTFFEMRPQLTVNTMLSKLKISFICFANNLQPPRLIWDGYRAGKMPQRAIFVCQGWTFVSFHPNSANY